MKNQPDQTYRDMFANITTQHAKKVFLETVTGVETYTYGELGRQVYCTARVLTKEGISPGDRVLLCLPNSPDFFIFFSAVIISGGIPVLANPSYTPNEIADLCNRATANHIIISDEHPSALSDLDDLKILTCSLFANQIASIKEDIDWPSLPTLRPDDTAYIIFSSGSTARPKGCLISHANLLSELHSMIRAYALDDSCVHLCMLPVFHASALYRNILMPFAQGGRVIISSGFDVDDFWNWIDKFSIGFVQTVPAILRTLLDHPGEPTKHARQSLQYIGSASAPLQAHTIELFEKRFSILIAQGYGLTETTCGVCFNDPRKKDGNLKSVGRPIDIADVSIVDESGALVEAGELGEVVISGPLVVTNYITDENVSGSKIVKGSLFTSDLGRLDEDGCLTIEGRKTDMIVRAGYNISPKEIEDALVTLSGINEAIAFGVPHESMGEDIIAYIRTSSEGKPNEKKLRNELKNILAPYKIPTRLLSFDSTYDLKDFKISRGGFRRHYLESRKALIGNAHQASSSERRSHPQKPRAFLWDNKVYLRPLMDADTKSSIYLDNIMNPGVQFYTYSGRFPQSEKAIRDYWENVSPPNELVFAICDLNTDEYVGNIALRIDWVARIAEFGRMIFKNFQSQPYSEYALQLLIGYAFDDLKLKRLWGGGANPASVPSLVRLGFTHEGTQRRHHFLRGQWRDQFMFGMLDSDHQEIKAGRRPNISQKNDLFDDEAVFQQVVKTFVEVFDVAPESITPATSAFEIPAWDSLGMVILWNLLEEHFAVSISSSDMISITCVEDIVTMLTNKLSASVAE